MKKNTAARSAAAPEKNAPFPSVRGENAVPPEKRAARRIIGVDPGLAKVGWGIIEVAGGRLRCLACGCIETEAGRPRAERLHLIHRELRMLLRAWKPSSSAIENLYFARNVSSALDVAEARGVITLALVQAGLLPREFTPNAIKQAVTGFSRADKAQVQEMTRLLLGLPEIPRPNHAADALAAAICAANTPEFAL